MGCQSVASLRSNQSLFSTAARAPITRVDGKQMTCALRSTNPCRQFSADTKSFACLSLALVSKEFSELAHMNVVWKRLYLRAFPFQNKKLRVRNWYRFFKRRFVHERYWGKTTFESLSIGTILTQFINNT